MIVSFETGERIILKARRHWFVFVMQVLPLAFFAILPIILFAWDALRENPSSGASLPLFFSGLLYLVLWILFFIVWTNYYFDVFILTDRRIIYISQKSLFSRRISSSRLDRVQDVSAEVSGMMPTFLNYGNIYVQTAAEEKEFAIHDIPNPDIVKDRILAEHWCCGARSCRGDYYGEKGE